MQTTLQMNDLVRILGLSIPTIHRRLKAAREGRDSFPLGRFFGCFTPLFRVEPQKSPRFAGEIPIF